MTLLAGISVAGHFDRLIQHAGETTTQARQKATRL